MLMRWDWFLLGLLLLFLLLLFVVSTATPEPLVVLDVSARTSYIEEIYQVTHDTRDRMPSPS